MAVDFLAYTVFTDRECTVVRSAYNLYGCEAEKYLDIFRRAKGWEPREGDVIWGARIDRIRSEDQSEAA
jgi:hypothetical protein